MALTPSGILPGKITDESVIARPAGTIVLHLAAAPSLIKRHPRARTLADLKTWPWVALGGFQFWSAKDVTLYARNGAEQTLPISPISEGLTSVREATRAGLGLAILPDWLIDDDLRTKRLVRVLPHWKTRDLPLHVVYARPEAPNSSNPQALNLSNGPARVTAFIDFAVASMTKELAPYT